MWRFSNLNPGNTLWPPDAGQQQDSFSPYDCSFSVNPNGSFPGFGTHVDSSFYPPLNHVFGSSEQEAVTPTKRLFIFDHSRDQTSLVYSSIASPFEGLNPPLPASYAHDSNHHVIEEEEMHEDTEEIDALLYSDSDYIDDEETSTGHSPYDMAEEDITSPHFPAKRRRINSAELDASLVDTASSAIAPRSHYMQEDGEDGDFDPRFVPEVRTGSSRCKQERIQHTMRVLRRIIPGGKGKDSATVLDEAIQYLNSLKLRAKSLGATSSSL